MPHDFGVGKAEQVLSEKFNAWRTAVPHRPFRIYHLKLVIYLILQIIEWLTDLAVMIYLEVETETADEGEYEGRHRLTAICYLIFFFAPWIVVGSLITAGRFIYVPNDKISDICLKVKFSQFLNNITKYEYNRLYICCHFLYIIHSIMVFAMFFIPFIMLSSKH